MQHHPLVQDLIVLDIVDQRRRHNLGVAGEVDCRTGDPDQRRVEPVEEVPDGGRRA